MKIILQEREDHWTAYREDLPAEWETGSSHFEALGRLLLVGIRMYGDRWPELEIEERRRGS